MQVGSNKAGVVHVFAHRDLGRFGGIDIHIIHAARNVDDHGIGIVEFRWRGSMRRSAPFQRVIIRIPLAIRGVRHEQIISVAFKITALRGRYIDITQGRLKQRDVFIQHKSAVTSTDVKGRGQDDGDDGTGAWQVITQNFHGMTRRQRQRSIRAIIKQVKPRIAVG